MKKDQMLKTSLTAALIASHRQQSRETRLPTCYNRYRFLARCCVVLRVTFRKERSNYALDNPEERERGSHCLSLAHQAFRRSSRRIFVRTGRRGLCRRRTRGRDPI